MAWQKGPSPMPPLPGFWSLLRVQRHRAEHCVRCAGPHRVAARDRPRSQPPTCANCAAALTANDRRCPAFRREARAKCPHRRPSHLGSCSDPRRSRPPSRPPQSAPPGPPWPPGQLGRQPAGTRPPPTPRRSQQARRPAKAADKGRGGPAAPAPTATALLGPRHTAARSGSARIPKEHLIAYTCFLVFYFIL